MTPAAPTDRLSRARAWLAGLGDLEGSLIAMGALTGLFTGLLAAALILLIQAVQALAWGDSVPPWQVVAVPTVGAFVVGLLLKPFPEVAGGGVVRTLETLVVRGGRFRRRVPVGSLVSTSIALGTGSSGGREGPMVLLGGATGSLVGQFFRVDEPRLRALVGAGVAAGIGAAFNAPIGGMLFAIEIVLGNLRTMSLQVVVVASVVASVTAREIVGEDLVFGLGQQYALHNPAELLGYLALGVVAAGLGIAIMRGERVAFAGFALLRRRLWRPVTLAIAGLGVGLVALLVPEVLGTGADLPPIDGRTDPVLALLTGDFGPGWSAVGTLALLLLAKFAATMLSVGSGSAVGTLMPTLFLGAAAGATFGTAVDALIPSAQLDPSTFALVGMAAGFAATARAPLTSILLVFELTGDYGMVLPLMLSCGIATWLADRIEPASVYSHALHERGIVHGELDDVDVLQAVSIAEVMTRDHPTVRAEQRLPAIRELFDRTGSHGFVVVDGGHRVAGVITRQDLDRVADHPLVASRRRTPDSLTAAEVGTPRPAVVNPDDPVHVAVHRMAALDIGRVPVVERHTGRLVGLIRRGDVVRAYQRGLDRHLGDQQRDASQRLRDLAGVEFVEVTVAPGSGAADRAIRDVPWPPRTIVTSIRRHGRVELPTGDTVLAEGDVLVLLADPAAMGHVRHLLTTDAAAVFDPTDPMQRERERG